MMVATIQKWGNSHGICIPHCILEAAQFDFDETVEIEAADGKIVIKKIAEHRKSIKELFDGFKGDYKKTEIDWGEPVGDEVW